MVAHGKRLQLEAFHVMPESVVPSNSNAQHFTVPGTLTAIGVLHNQQRQHVHSKFQGSCQAPSEAASGLHLVFLAPVLVRRHFPAGLDSRATQGPEGFRAGL